MGSMKIVIASLISAALCVSAIAQTSSGSIAGNVRDAQDASIANATVTITEQEKKVKLATRTDAEGRFVFPQLLPGRYDIKIESAGFKPVERKDVVLLANDKISVGVITLEIGAVTESVEVQAESVQLRTESSERSEA